MDTTYEPNAAEQERAESGPTGAPTPAPERAWDRGAYRASEAHRKSPGLAGFLSFVMPGLGQIYVGYYQRGFLHAVVFGMLVTVLAWGRIDNLAPLFGVFLAFFYLYNVIDAYRRAIFFNQALSGPTPLSLIEDLKPLGPGGSMVAGALLVGFGLLVLLETKFNISMDWIEDWWPLAPIALGVYLLLKAVRERRESAAE